MLLTDSTICSNIDCFMNFWCVRIVAKSAYYVRHVRPYVSARLALKDLYEILY